MKALICGDTGLLGQAIVREWSARHQVTGLSRAAAPPPRLAGMHYEHIATDLVNLGTAGIDRLMQRVRPDVVVNCVAIADVAACEKDPGTAESVNVKLAENLAVAAKKSGCGLAHISTDQVFDGRQKVPYRETDATAPLNRYGRTKRDAERAVAAAHPAALIVRTNIVGVRGETARPTFAEWVFASLAEARPISLAEDFVTSSMHVDDLAVILERACGQALQGLFHIAASDAMSKYEFGRMLAAELKLDFKNVRRCRLSELKLVPERPEFLALDVTRAAHALGAIFPDSRQTILKLTRDFKTLGVQA